MRLRIKKKNRTFAKLKNKHKIAIQWTLKNHPKLH